MAKKIARLGLQRDNNFMYYIKDGAVWATPRKRPGKPAGQKRKITQFASPGELDYSRNLYYIDGDGDVVASEKKGRGGSKAKVSKPVKLGKPAKPSKPSKPSKPAKPAKAEPSFRELMALASVRKTLGKRR